VTSPSFSTVIFSYYLSLQKFFSHYLEERLMYSSKVSAHLSCAKHSWKPAVTCQNLGLLLIATKKCLFSSFLNHSLGSSDLPPTVTCHRRHSAPVSHLALTKSGSFCTILLLKPLKPQLIIVESCMQGFTLLKKSFSSCMDFHWSTTVVLA